MSSAKWRPFCLGLNVLNSHPVADTYMKLRAWSTLGGFDIVVNSCCDSAAIIHDFPLSRELIYYQ